MHNSYLVKPLAVFKTIATITPLNILTTLVGCSPPSKSGFQEHSTSEINAVLRIIVRRPVPQLDHA